MRKESVAQRRLGCGRWATGWIACVHLAGFLSCTPTEDSPPEQSQEVVTDPTTIGEIKASKACRIEWDEYGEGEIDELRIRVFDDEGRFLTESITRPERPQEDCSWHYDADGRLGERECRDEGESAAHYRSLHSYDDGGREILIEVQRKGAADQTIEKRYDAEDQLSERILRYGMTVAERSLFEYRQNRLYRISRFDGGELQSQELRSYDQGGFLARSEVFDSRGVLVEAHVFERDARGHLLSRTIPAGDQEGERPAREREEWMLDTDDNYVFGQLVMRWDDSGEQSGSPVWTANLAYDDMGRVTQREIAYAYYPGTTSRWVYRYECEGGGS